MNDAKATTIGAALGAVAGSILVTLLSANQIDIAEHWTATALGVGAGVTAAAAAILAAIKRFRAR